MLRHELGDAAFWRAIGLYARKHAHGSVETRDLARAIEEATGRNVDELLDRWMARPAIPSWRRAGSGTTIGKIGTLRIAQKQRSRPRRRRSSSRRRSASRSTAASATSASACPRATHAFEFRLPARPTQVIFDPGDVVLKSIRLEKTRPCGGASCGGAAGGRSRGGGARARPAARPGRHRGPRDGVAGRPFWGVRAAAARALGQTRRDAARDALVAAIDDEHPRVRRPWPRPSASSCGDEAAAAALARWPARGRRQLLRRGRSGAGARADAHDRSADAAAVAARPAVVPGRHPQPGRGGARALGRRARVSRSCAMPGGPACRGSAGARSSRRWRSSRAAPGSPAAAREFIEARLADRDFRVRGEAAVGAGAARIDRGDRRARGPPVPPSSTAVPAGAWRRPSAISRPAPAPARRFRHLHDEVERLRGETAKLRERLDRLQAQGAGGAPPPASPAPKAKRPRPVTRRTRGSRPVRR